MKRTIVKVQLPVVSNTREEEALIYAQSRLNMTQRPASKDLKAKMAGRLKAFFYAEWNHGKSEWLLGDEAPMQAW